MFGQKSNAIGFAFFGKICRFQESSFFAKSKAIGFAFSVKFADIKNHHFLQKVRL